MSAILLSTYTTRICMSEKQASTILTFSLKIIMIFGVNLHVFSTALLINA